MSWEKPTKEQRRVWKRLRNSVVFPNGYACHAVGIVTGFAMLALGAYLRLR